MAWVALLLLVFFLLYLIAVGLDVVVSISQSKSARVAQDDTYNFSTVGKAITFVPNDTTIEEGGYFAIYVSEVRIGRIGVWGLVHHLRHDLREHGRAMKKQAMAMRNNADLSIFYHCKLLGYQDTLYVHSNHQFYCDYEVYDTVDFIFGDASPCSRIATSTHVYCSRGNESGDDTGSHSLQWEHRLLQPQLHNRGGVGAGYDELLSEDLPGAPMEGVLEDGVHVVYVERMVEAVGWMTWNDSFALSTLYYGEYQNYAPSATKSGRVQWLGYRLMNMTNAYKFTVNNFITGEGVVLLLAFFLLCLIVIGFKVVVLISQSKSVRMAQDDTDNFITVGEAITLIPNDITVEEGG
ncbi:pectinesterase-like [Zingiber officinale]|uniref:pectinesterase-like n=1 Tax=Zingiber officinale TaxID=94328 RepID=UPI001C4B01DB|nr:pectinesterase-like [Zingiber officinale]